MSADILRGASKIVNTANVNHKINIEELEQSIINDSKRKYKEISDPITIFDNEVQRYMKEFGLSLDEHPTPELAKETTSLPTQDSKSNYSNNYSFNEYDTKENIKENIKENAKETIKETYPTDYSVKESYPVTRSRLTNSFKIDDEDKYKPNYHSERTNEQRRQDTISNVMNEMGSSNNIFSIEREKTEDIKATMLEEIDFLRIALEEDDVDISRVPKVDQMSSYEQIETILKILRLKSDRMRYCSFAEEFLIFGAYGLEDLFNGERTWLGRYKPDLTGWHTQVQTKLRRMRHDTSSLVSMIMHDCNIGPGFRVLLELVPNAFVYSKTRRQQYGTPTVYNDGGEVSKYIDNIRNIEEK